MNQPKIYNPAVDILRLLAILAVILIHTTTKALEITHFDLLSIPWTLFLNQISRFAVPLFFMISGFVLELSYSSNTSYFSYLIKRLNRIVIPYIFWSAVYFLFVYPHPGASFLSALIYGSSSHQLYFIPTLLIFYAFFPLFHRLYNLLSQKWLLLILFIVQIYFLYKDYYFHQIGFSLSYPFLIALFNYFVFLIGIIAARHQSQLIIIATRYKYLLIFLSISLAFFVFYQGQSQYLKTYNYQAFYSQWRPSVLLYTFALSGILYYLFSQKQFLNSIFKTLSQLSFFVFFIHIIILETIWNNIALPLMKLTDLHIAQNLFFDPLFFIITTFISFSIAYLVHRLPLLSRLTG